MRSPDGGGRCTVTVGTSPSLRGRRDRLNAGSRWGTSAGRRWSPDLPIGLAAMGFSCLYLLSDVIEVVQGGFSVSQLWLTLVAEAAIPVVVLGVALAQRPHLSRIGWLGAWAYAYSFAFFTGTVIYALARGTDSYRELSQQIGPLLLLHGAIMVIAGLALGRAILAAGVLPAWTAWALMMGVLLVASTQTLPAAAALAAAAVRDVAFAGMGVALLSRRRR